MRTKAQSVADVVDLAVRRERAFVEYNFLPLDKFAERIGRSREETRDLICLGRIRGAVNLATGGNWPRYMVPPAEVERFLSDTRTEAERWESEAEPIGTLRRSGIYVVRADGLGRYKIGVSFDVDRRLNGLQTACPVAISLVAFVSGGTADECALHARFASSRLHGEWFSETPELLAFIEEHCV